MNILGVGLAARLNALRAVELDGPRLRERLLDRRLAAAVLLTDRVEVAEALLAGSEVPVHRLDVRWVRLLDLKGVVRLDEELAVRMAGWGPLESRP